MKKILCLLIITTLLFGSFSFADSDYTELKLSKLYFNTTTKMFTSIKLYDESRKLYIEFPYHDSTKYYQQYAHSRYYYDYEKDLLLIMHRDNVLYRDFDYGREK